MTIHYNIAKSFNLIGWVRVHLGCCYGNSAYAHIVMYNILTIRVRALKSTADHNLVDGY